MMKKRILNEVRAGLAVGLAAWATGPWASAQTEATLGIQPYAGLSITGEVGQVYAIEYVSDLARSNQPTAWRCLEYLQLPASPYLWTDKSSPATDRRFYRAVAMDAPTNMVFIPPGTFRMGSPTNEVGRNSWEGLQTEVIISRGFWMGIYEVTQAEYLAVMGSNPSFFNGMRTNWPADPGGNDYGTDLTRPVEMVSQLDALGYCAALTQQERAAGRIAANAVYRLPTEAEWEYACRARTSTRFSHGDDPGYTNLTDYAWHRWNGDIKTHPVGQKLSNPWGLYDMHGNIAEWCQDLSWMDPLPGGTVVDPQGFDEGDEAVFKSGSYLWEGMDLRSAFRNNRARDYLDSRFGFRVVLTPGQP